MEVKYRVRWRRDAEPAANLQPASCMRNRRETACPNSAGLAIVEGLEPTMAWRRKGAEIFLMEAQLLDKDRTDPSDYETELDDKARPKQGLPISRRRFLSGAATMGVAATVMGLSWLVETKAAKAALDDVAAARNPMATEIGPTSGPLRAEQAMNVRITAAQFESSQSHPDHPDNGDEGLFPNKIASYAKALPHNSLGEVELAAYNTLIHALTTGKPEDFEAITLGGDVRLTNPQAALAFNLLGPDSHQLAIPPVPAFNTAWAAAEMGELYWQALARDVPFSQYEANDLTLQAATDLSGFSDFRGPQPGGQVTPQTLFRGGLPGELAGPYISQFLWADLPFGAIPVIQRMRTAVTKLDFLTAYDEWLAIQNGAVAAAENDFDPIPRYIRSGRDLGEWVHRDWVFQSSLQACLILLAFGATVEREGGLLPRQPARRDADGDRVMPLLSGNLTIASASAPLDPGNPYARSGTQAGFATLGAQDILDLVSCVANRALKAAWYQKWLVHRRLRPEEFGGRIHNQRTGRAGYPIHGDILNSSVLGRVFDKYGTYLLPQAYPEGCPAHPSYPSGHATAVGASCTVLKALFDESFVMPNPVVVSDDGLSLEPFEGPGLTVGGELNKLASNIAMGRNFAGIHYRTDAIDGMKLGEEFAIRFLRETKLTYYESFPGFALTKFDGSTIVVGAPATTAANPLRLDARVSTENGVTLVDIWITNNSGSGIAQLEIRGAIPPGGTFVSASPSACEMQGNEVVWFNMAGLGPGQTLSGFQYEFGGGTGSPSVTVNFIGQARGTVSTG